MKTLITISIAVIITAALLATAIAFVEYGIKLIMEDYDI